MSKIDLIQINHNDLLINKHYNIDRYMIFNEENIERDINHYIQYDFDIKYINVFNDDCVRIKTLENIKNIIHSTDLDFNYYLTSEVNHKTKELIIRAYPIVESA